AQGAAAADFRLPQDLAIVVRIERPHHTRFLTAQKNLSAVGQLAQNRRTAEIVIRPSLLRAVADARLATTDQEVVFGADLVHPFDLARFHLERHDRVRAPGLDVGVGIASADVDQPALRIEGRRRPDRAARGAVHLRPYGILLKRLRFLLNCETLPDYFPGVSVEREETAAECAAFVFGIASGRLFERGDWHVEAVAIERGSASNAREKMVIDF